MKWNLSAIIAVMFIISNILTGYITYIGMRYNVTHRWMYDNLRYTEQIKFLLSSLKIRLEQEDSSVLEDISNFAENYNISYEGQPFYELVRKYFKNEFINHEFIYKKTDQDISNLVSKRTKEITKTL